MSDKNIRTIAFYLPQYHPVPENDAAWGEGFTEWVNVRKVSPLFKDHYQPHIPHESIGYYDLRYPNVLVKQTALAREHGIYGFAFYHYWFNGKRLLNTPVDDYLKNQTPDFPFCLCWANENWTRRWDGQDKEIIVKQEYSFEDDREHIRFLCKNVFTDQRYITVDNKPLFIIYKPELFPDIKKTVQIWREEAVKLGIGKLYLCYVENGIYGKQPSESGFEAAVEFQPQWKLLRCIRKGNILLRVLHKLGFSDYFYESFAVYDYARVSKKMMRVSSQASGYKKYPCITPMWDNSARRKTGAVVFDHSTPELYGTWLRAILKNFKPYSPQENFIFINAWNEWAEGNHLEPCQKWGKQYLEVTKSIIDNA